MKNTPEEGLAINEHDMHHIILAVRAIRLLSKHKTMASLMNYLAQEETCHRADGKLYWNKPDLRALKKVEDKFAKRLKKHKLYFFKDGKER